MKKLLLLFLTTSFVLAHGGGIVTSIDERYESGNIKAISLYNRLKYHHKLILARKENYHENGQMSFEGTYNKDGERNGKWKYYNEDGSIDRVEKYKDGVRVDKDK